VFDVGGQRNERRKWVHCFEDVTAVIFVASLSEYDQMLYEDETVPRMTEALNLFGEITNSRWFKNTAVLLFLNKSDLFREKIQHTPISVFFDDYAGDPHSFSMSALHIQTHFEARNRQSNREIYTHVTCATDTQNVEKVFTAAKDIVIKASLRKGGLL
jgi:GTPase SAR1 family protein